MSERKFSNEYLYKLSKEIEALPGSDPDDGTLNYIKSLAEHTIEIANVRAAMKEMGAQIVQKVGSSVCYKISPDQKRKNRNKAKKAHNLRKNEKTQP